MTSCTTRWPRVSRRLSWVGDLSAELYASRWSDRVRDDVRRHTTVTALRRLSCRRRHAPATPRFPRLSPGRPASRKTPPTAATDADADGPPERSTDADGSPPACPARRRRRLAVVSRRHTLLRHCYASLGRQSARSMAVRRHHHLVTLLNDVIYRWVACRLRWKFHAVTMGPIKSQSRIC